MVRRTRWLGISFALCLAATAEAQPPANSAPPPTNTPTIIVEPETPATSPTPGQAEGIGSLPPESRQERVADIEQPPAEAPALGPTAPENLGWFNDLIDKTRIYGWVDGGYTYASTGSGLLSVEPRENRFGDEFLLNQMAVVFDKPLDETKLSFGFNVTYYAGADAALLQPKGGIDDPPDNSRFSHDFRQLYLSAHLPILTEGGMDVQFGRMGTIIGYEGALSPYRPFYSNDYQWFYAEDGAFTGLLTNLHVNKQLDIWNGITLGANTFFTLRSENSYCYIGQINYWLQPEKKTLLSASVYAGPNAVFAAPGLAGTFDTTIELRIQQNWSKCLTQIIQSDDGWDANVPGVGTGSWYSLYTILIYHMSPKLDLNLRGEWFDDVQGTRTGIATAYEEGTVGFDYHPYKWVSFRPEVRGDFADERAFGSGGVPSHHSQLTVAFDLLFKY